MNKSSYDSCTQFHKHEEKKTGAKARERELFKTDPANQKVLTGVRMKYDSEIFDCPDKFHGCFIISKLRALNRVSVLM